MRFNKRLPSLASARQWWLGLLLAGLIFLPRLIDLDIFLTADEPLFLEQSRQFATALITGEPSQTLGIGYPAITLAWWTAPAISLRPPGDNLAVYGAGRLANGFVTGGLLILLYLLASRLLGNGPAFIALSLLALDPFLLGYNRLFHIAAPLALLMTLSGLSHLLWLRDRHPIWLLLTGLLIGLSLLTKSTALLLLPMLLIISLTWHLSQFGSKQERRHPCRHDARRDAGAPREQLRPLSSLLSPLSSFLPLLLIASLTFVLLWPAMWVDPVAALILTFGKLLTDQEAGTGNLGMFWFGQFVDDPGPAFYPVIFLLKVTPGLIIGLTLSLYVTLRRRPLSLSKGRSLPKGAVASTSSTTGTRHQTEPADSQLIGRCLWLFALTYLLLMTLASKKSVRYLLPAWPTFYLLSGLALYQFRLYLARLRKRLGLIAIAGLIISQIALLLPYHPYYLTYYNPLILGWRIAPQTILVGWGEGLDQAAAYLNRQANQQPVTAWYEWLFTTLYAGPVQPVVPPENLLTAPYSVLYLNQVQRDIPNPNIIHYFRTRRQPAHTVELSGIPYAWIYPGPIVGFQPPTPQHPQGGEFAGEARLLGYDRPDNPLSGEPLLVTLYWQALASELPSRFVYVRLIDQRGHIWAKSDSPPVMGLWPTTQWQAEMIIEDIHQLPIPAGTPPGSYRLEVGMYNPDSGQPLPATGQPLGAGGGLLVGQLQLEWQALSAATDLPHPTEVRVAPNARLTGYTSLPPEAVIGDRLPIELSWQEDSSWAMWLDPLANDGVMFEWRQSGRYRHKQLDDLPLPIAQWGPQAVLRSYHEVIVPPTLPAGRYDLTVMLHTGSDPAGQAVHLGSMEITTPPQTLRLPPQASPPPTEARFVNRIELAGYHLVKPDATRYNLDLYWRTTDLVTNHYRVFVQLLTEDNQVIAQSDQFPAAGQRPTTGWRPQEIITDAHTLTLPPDIPPGGYRLIAGFYDPVTGHRLPLATGGEFITITEERP